MNRDLENHALPGGTVTIEPYESWLVSDALQSPQMPEGLAHPLYAYLVGHAGMGLTFAELFALCESGPDDGPMQGEVDLEYFRPFEVGVVTKVGRKAGSFDVVTYQLDMLEKKDLVGRATCSIVFPRRA